ncbi:MAG: hypothetical protein Q9208_004987 [Pyrenodesmia sp. 3 TL-2023]
MLLAPAQAYREWRGKVNDFIDSKTKHNKLPIDIKNFDLAIPSPWNNHSKAPTTVTSPPATHTMYPFTLNIDPDDLPELPTTAAPLPLLVMSDAPLDPEEPVLPGDVPLPLEEPIADPYEPPEEPEELPPGDDPEVPDDPPEELPDEPAEEPPEDPAEEPPEEPPAEEPPADELGRSSAGLKSMLRLVKVSMVGIVRAETRPHEARRRERIVLGRMIARSDSDRKECCLFRKGMAVLICDGGKVDEELPSRALLTSQIGPWSVEELPRA